MPVLRRSTLKTYFRDGKSLTNQGFVALIDSGLSLIDTTAQQLASELSVPEIVGAVSAGDGSFRTSLLASAATLTGVIRHGTSGASIGYPVLTQRATAAATAQVALLAKSSNITGFSVNVLAASSAGAGGSEIRVGNAAAMDYFGTITVSGVGRFRFTDVCARRLQNTSGAVFMAPITATAAANFIGEIEYYRVTDASVAAAQSSGGGGGGGDSFTVTITASENNPNMVTKFINAGWDGVSSFTGNITINASVIVGTTSTGTPAIDLSSASFPAGTTFTLTNNGRVQGMGGAGGRGANTTDENGVAGSAGGTALKVTKSITITNSSGEIWGGAGGGGGGGASKEQIGEQIVENRGGGGGGGGAGTNAGAAGAGGAGTGSGTPDRPGSAGSAGTAAAGGAGGAGGTASPPNTGDGGNGGSGGAPGASGSAGANGTGAIFSLGGSGGAAGKSIDGIANVTWNGGSNDPNLKGPTA